MYSSIIDETAAMIAPYVQKDQTKFYTEEEFTLGVETIKEFCTLREKSILGQLNGTIPSTTQGRNDDSTALVDAFHLELSAMGSMGGGMGGFGGNSGGGQGNSVN